MTTLGSALSYNFTSAESARIVQADRGAQETIAAQLGQSNAASPFAVGTTITARYQYRVAEDGSLVALQTQITTEVPKDGPQAETNRRNGRNLQRRDDRQPTFADIARARVTLSPSEELAVFGAISNGGQTTQQAALQQQLVNAFSPLNIAAQASDENGQPVEAEVLTFRRENADTAEKQRAQYSVATLYARNNDVVYNVSPISQLAA
ncbi:MAG: hypothetical protein K2Q14_04565 [Gammaproteobacteria bacterium]|nr:hypothetical protein [Gammaproteobacteria bacterium]